MAWCLDIARSGGALQWRAARSARLQRFPTLIYSNRSAAAPRYCLADMHYGGHAIIYSAVYSMLLAKKGRLSVADGSAWIPRRSGIAPIVCLLRCLVVSDVLCRESTRTKPAATRWQRPSGDGWCEIIDNPANSVQALSSRARYTTGI